jgi:hypothetical protein
MFRSCGKQQQQQQQQWQRIVLAIMTEKILMAPPILLDTNLDNTLQTTIPNSNHLSFQKVAEFVKGVFSHAPSVPEQSNL